jgi:hypothetical protein
VSVPTCVCVQCTSLKKRSYVICPILYRQPIFLCPCPPPHHYILWHTRDGQRSQILEEKGPLSYIRHPIANLFSSVGSNLCVGLIRYMLWHTRDGQSSQILEEKVPYHISDTLSPTFFLLSVATCVSASLGTCCDTPEMGRAAKYWRKKFHYDMSGLIANLFSYVGAHLCVCIITCWDTPEVGGADPW